MQLLCRSTKESTFVLNIVLVFRHIPSSYLDFLKIHLIFCSSHILMTEFTIALP